MITEEQLRVLELAVNTIDNNLKVSDKEKFFREQQLVLDLKKTINELKED